MKNKVLHILDTVLRTLALMGIPIHYAYTIYTLSAYRFLSSQNTANEIYDLEFGITEIILPLIPSYILLLSIFKPNQVSKNVNVGNFFAYLLGIITPLLIHPMQQIDNEKFEAWLSNKNLFTVYIESFNYSHPIFLIGSFLIAYYFVNRFYKKNGEVVNEKTYTYLLMIVAQGITIASMFVPLILIFILWSE